MRKYKKTAHLVWTCEENGEEQNTKNGYAVQADL